MSIYNYFINESFTIIQNTDIFAEQPNLDLNFYDYIFNVNMGDNNGNSLFSLRSFKQLTNEPNSVDENNVIRQNVIENVDFVIVPKSLGYFFHDVYQGSRRLKTKNRHVYSLCDKLESKIIFL